MGQLVELRCGSQASQREAAAGHRRTYDSGMATQGWPTGESGLDGLIGASSTPEVHTFVWALTSFLSGLGALLGTRSRPRSGSRCAAACVSGWSSWRSSDSGTSNLDTAFGDAQLPTLHKVLEWLNAGVGAQ